MSSTTIPEAWPVTTPMFGVGPQVPPPGDLVPVERGSVQPVAGAWMLADRRAVLPSRTRTALPSGRRERYYGPAMGGYHRAAVHRRSRSWVLGRVMAGPGGTDASSQDRQPAPAEGSDACRPATSIRSALGTTRTGSSSRRRWRPP
jgi:hypothetical protein